MKQRAFIRYTKQGRIVPGSLIITQGDYPKGPGTFSEVPVDSCCQSGHKVVMELEFESFPITTPAVEIYCPFGPTLVSGAILGTFANASELAEGLNAQLGWMGVFSAEGTNVAVQVATSVATTLTQDPTCDILVGAIYPFGM